MTLVIETLLMLSLAALVQAMRLMTKHVKLLETRLEMLEHPERFPPQHPRCRSQTYIERGLNEPDRPVNKRGGGFYSGRDFNERKP
jgi:hypothetical protein